MSSAKLEVVCLVGATLALEVINETETSELEYTALR